MIHETTRYTRYESYREHKGDTMETKSKLYLRIILLIDYMMKEKSACLCRVVSCKVCSFTVFCQKKSHKKRKEKKRKRVTPGWPDISAPGPVSFLSRSFIYYTMLILHNPINSLKALAQTAFIEHLILNLLLHDAQTTWDGCNLPKETIPTQNLFALPFHLSRGNK